METNQPPESPDPTPSPAPAEAGATAETGLGTTEQPGVDASSQPSDPPADPQPEYDLLDTEELGEKHVRVKVDGEEIVVPLSEALQGYTRTKDYTQKTQQAAEALRLAQAIQTNPGLTMQVLASQNGMSVEEFLNLTPQQQQAAAQETAPEDIPPNDPIERKLWEQDRTIRAMQEQLAEERFGQQLRQTMSGLQQQYGATEEEQLQVVSAAQQMTRSTGQPVGPEFFPMILASMRYQQTLGQQQAQDQVAQQRQADDAQRQAAAAAASDVVTSGQPSAASTTPIPADGNFSSLTEAIEASLDSLGVT